MNVIVNAADANIIIRTAISEVTESNWIPSGPASELISEVILGGHLTYRYILTTGILSKATNRNCNPLALQAGSNLDGAYDARSICHGVVVPVERDLLGGRLGESNEPFLNKPARYPELSSSNAVRRGRDTRLLDVSIRVLSSLESSEYAYQCLKDCIYYILQRPSRNISDYLVPSTDRSQQSTLISFANMFLSESFEGESCAIITGAAYSLLGIAQSKLFDVRVHKVNQAGSSSREVSDIDVYENGCLVHTIEVKDKVYTAVDVQHAVNKAAASGLRSLVFAVGPRGRLIGSSMDEIVNYWGQQGFNLYFVDVMSHFVSILATTPNIDQRIFMDIVNYHVEQSKIKDLTFNRILECASYQGW